VRIFFSQFFATEGGVRTDWSDVVSRAHAAWGALPAGDKKRFARKAKQRKAMFRQVLDPLRSYLREARMCEGCDEVDPLSPWQNGDSSGPLRLGLVNEEFEKPNSVRELSAEFIKRVGEIVRPDRDFPEFVRKDKTCFETYGECGANVTMLHESVARELLYALRLVVSPLGGHKLTCPILTFEAEGCLYYVQVLSHTHGPFRAELMLGAGPRWWTLPPFNLAFELPADSLYEVVTEIELFLRFARDSVGPWKIRLLEFKEQTMALMNVTGSTEVDIAQARKDQIAHLTVRKALKALRDS
jgi:hypothetical protein